MRDAEERGSEGKPPPRQMEELARKNIRLASGLGLLAVLVYIGFFLLYG